MAPTRVGPASLRQRFSTPPALLAALLSYWALVVAGFAAFAPYSQSPRLAQALLAVALAGCAGLVAKIRLTRAGALADGALAVLAIGAALNAAVVPTPQGQVLTGLPIVLGAMFAGYYLPPIRLRLQLVLSIGGYLLATRVNPLIPSLLYPLSISVAALVAAGMVSSLASRQQVQIRTLGEALDKVRTLSGLLPICMHCMRIRNDRGYWDRIEQYVTERTDALFSHGLCPDCVERYLRDSGLESEIVQVKSALSGGHGVPDEIPLELPGDILRVLPVLAVSRADAGWRIPGVRAQVLLAVLLGLLGLMAGSFAAFPPYPETSRLLNGCAAAILTALAIALIIARRREPPPLVGVAVAAYTTFAALFAATSPTPQGQMLDALPVVLAGIFASYFLSRRQTVLQVAWGIGAFGAGMVVNPLIPSPLYLASVVLSAVVATAMVGTLAAQQRRRIRDLREALDHVRTLSGLLPICMYCKKVRNDAGYWDRIEEYIADRTNASFSQALCPDCEGIPEHLAG